MISPGGLVVDYLGIADPLKQALADYTERDRGRFLDVVAQSAMDYRH